MIDAMIQELDIRYQWQQPFMKQSLTTLYFGGGTPSLLEYNELESVLKKIQEIWNVRMDELLEVTIECNPEDVSPEKIKEWKNLGFNRLSVGLQSLNDEELKAMNRHHTAEESKKCIEIALEGGFENISVDLIYGTPWKSNKDWENELNWAIKSGVTHLSCYALTVEEKTLLHHQIENQHQKAPSDEKMVQQFEILIDKLMESGWDDYEISNFCKPGFNALHNSNYWKRLPYLGIGPSAHSFDGKFQRSWNVSNNAEYMRCIENKTVWYEQEVLNEIEVFNETIMTGLRTKAGIDNDIFSSLNAKNIQISHQKITDFKHSNWLEESGSKIRLTHSGRLISDFIISELMID